MAVDWADVTIKILQGIAYGCYFIVLGIFYYAKLIFYKIVPPKEKSIDGEIFLITGSSTGIGKSVVLKLAKEHKQTTLVLWDWNNEENQKTAKEAKRLGARAVHTYKVDVSDRDQVRETAEKVQKDVGDVTILFNNAGIARIGDFFKTPEEEIEKVMQVNVISHFWTLRAFLPSMMDRNHGHIVTTASLGAYFAVRHCLPYFAAKYAIRGYVESLKDELYVHPKQPHNIKFSTVFPAFVATPMTTKVQFETNGVKHQMMDTEYVANIIVKGILQNQEKIFLPPAAELLVLFKSVVPTALFEKIQHTIVKDRTVTYDD